MTAHQHNSRPEENSNSVLVIFLQLLMLVILAIGVFYLINAPFDWLERRHVESFERSLMSGEVKNDQTTVIELPTGELSGRRAYYKLGTSAYANGLRMAGVGCRMRTGGSILSFDYLKPGTEIPESVVKRVTHTIGHCDARALPQPLDRAKAFQ